MRYRIGLNAICIDNSFSGANQRFFSLYKSLIERMPECDFFLFHARGVNMNFVKKNTNVHLIQTPFLSNKPLIRNIFSIFYLRYAAKKYELDLLEYFNLPCHKIPRTKIFVTIHDIRRIYESKGFLKWFIKKIHSYSLLNADQIITVSQSMKSQLIAEFPEIREEKITSIYNGITQAHYHKLENPSSHFFPKEFVLSVGHMEPRKNYETLIKAFSFVKIAIPSLSLVIIGRDAGQKKKLSFLIKKLGLSDSVYIYLNINQSQLIDAYKLSSIFCFPSKYEGFGIPLLEAMFFNKPMVLSKIDVFKEVAGEIYNFAEPNSPEDFANQIIALHQDKKMCLKQIKFGQKRLREFKYDDLASKLSLLYLKNQAN